ncbi:MAG: hypothetical protein ACK5Y2_11580 [Bdellovibrionales bacterium]
MSETLKKEDLFSWKGVLALLAWVYVATIWLNPGFMGTDEYWTGITRYVPAQTQDYQNMLREDDVKSPTQLIPFVWLADRALELGLKAPYDQYRFVQIFFGLLSLTVLLFALIRYSDPDSRAFRALTFTFYAAAPFALTRPMYESVSAAFVLLSALALQDFLQNPERRSQVWVSTLAISCAFAFRPQAGIAALALPFFLLQRRHFKSIVDCLGLGLLAFIILGLPDLILRGSWHHSLKAILFYNVKHGASYGEQPWYYYLVLTLALLWAPFWISRAFPSIQRRMWPQHQVFWTMILAVVFLHSLFPQKWERFLIPVLPLLLWILADGMQEFWRRGHRTRVISLALLNFALWIPASFFPAQQNILQVSLYLETHPNVRVLQRLNRNPEWITEAFVQRADWQWHDITQVPSTALPCETRLIMNQRDFESLSDLGPLEVEKVFETNFLEKVAYRLNPTKNVRRTPLYLLRSRTCSQAQISSS